MTHIHTIGSVVTMFTNESQQIFAVCEAVPETCAEDCGILVSEAGDCGTPA